MTLTQNDIDKMLKANWWRSVCDGIFCMENSKTIFIPNQMPRFKVVTFQSKANDL